MAIMPPASNDIAKGAWITVKGPDERFDDEAHLLFGGTHGEQRGRIGTDGDESVGAQMELPQMPLTRL